MKPSIFLKEYVIVHKRWTDLLNNLTATELEKSGSFENFSIKDLIAHISWYETQMVELLESKSLIGSDLWSFESKKRNQVIFKMNAERNLQDVLIEFNQVSKKIMNLIGDMSEEEMNNPMCYSKMPEEWVPWKVIAENTTAHYKQHALDLEKRLQKIKKKR